MASLDLRAHGAADAATAWERYAAPVHWPGWAPQIQRVDTAMARLVAGGTGTVRAGLRPHPTLPVPFEVLAVDETARTWSWRVRLGPVRLLLEHAVTTEPGGCATSLRLHGPLPLLLGYAPVARRALTRLVRA